MNSWVCLFHENLRIRHIHLSLRNLLHSAFIKIFYKLEDQKKKKKLAKDDGRDRRDYYDYIILFMCERGVVYRLTYSYELLIRGDIH